MSKVLRLLLVGVALLGAAACGGGGAADPVVKLDGSPRIPSQEGVVQKADKNGITLDGDRNYKVDPKLIAFSTFNRSPVRLGSTVGEYVQVGLKGTTVVWLGRVGPVTTQADGHSSVIYQGRLVKIDGDRLIFRDGTVLTLAKGLKAPADAAGAMIASINPTTHVVEGATFK